MINRPHRFGRRTFSTLLRNRLILMVQGDERRESRAWWSSQWSGLKTGRTD